MKKRILITCCAMIATIIMQAQVTQINSNKSLQVNFPLTNNKAIVISELDSTIWVTDGTLTGTTAITTTIKYEDEGLLLSGKFIFRGSTLSTGSELYISDGTIGGTVLVRDIIAGSTGSEPGDFALMNGFIYFSAVTAAEGRELWKSNGTLAGTTLVKDIIPGSTGSNNIDQYNIFTYGNNLLFAARTAANGVELWKSDGTGPGTNLLLDINTGNGGADSSNPDNFYALNSIVLFSATTSAAGNEIWKTDGTAGGTVLLKDINPGAASSTELEILPGFSFSIFFGFHTFNNRAYFQAYDGTNTGNVWSTDGTPVNTTLLKNIVSGQDLSFLLMIDAVNLPGKFIFPVSDGTIRSELWVSDGTPAGTLLFKSFSPASAGELPSILVPFVYDFVNLNITQVLFQGNKFFFTAGTAAEGTELWISDGSIGGTSVVKDINPGPSDGLSGISSGISYLYTNNTLFFPADDGTHGAELWRSNGTSSGTTLVADILTGALGSNPLVNIFLVNGKVLFEADNGDSPGIPFPTDLYAVDGSFIPLPVILTDFTVAEEKADALLKWFTEQEINSKDFTIQRSFDGVHFNTIGKVIAAGNTTTRNAYTFTDAGIIKSGQKVLYYRLLSADMDARTAYSDVVTLKLKSYGWNVRMLTNPVLDDIKIEVSGVSGFVHVAINDFNGKTVYSNKLQNTNSIINIPAANLPHGVYVLIVTNGQDKKSVRFLK